MNADQFNDTYDNLVDLLWENEGSIAMLLPSMDGRPGLGVIYSEIPPKSMGLGYHEDRAVRGKLHCSVALMAREVFSDVFEGGDFDTFATFSKNFKDEEPEWDDPTISFDPDFDLDDDDGQ
jgi:hypothetical protein